MHCAGAGGNVAEIAEDDTVLVVLPEKDVITQQQQQQQQMTDTMEQQAHVNANNREMAFSCAIAEAGAATLGHGSVASTFWRTSQELLARSRRRSRIAT